MKIILYFLIIISLISCGANKHIDINKMPGIIGKDINTSNPILPDNERLCLVQPSNSSGGVETTSDSGVTWGTCLGFICSPNYMEDNNGCQLINLSGVMNIADEASSGYNSFFTDKDNTVSGNCIPLRQLDFKISYNNLGSTLYTDSVNCQANGTYTVTFLYSAVSHLPIATYNNYNLEIWQGANNTAYLKIPLNKVSMTNTCAITNGSGTQNYISNGIYTACSISSCNTGYTSNGTSCDINSYSITVNKLTNRTTVNDITLGLLSANAASTSVSQNYNYGQMIVLEATPESGYSITGWTGCDSVSTDFLRCTIASISANRTVVPVTSANLLTLTVAWNNSSIGAITNGYTVLKNGVSCSGACLSTFQISDTVRVTADPGTDVSDVSSWNLTGTYTGLNTATTNQADFTMSGTNITVTMTALDKVPTVASNYNIDIEYNASPHTSSSSLGSKDTFGTGIQYIYLSDTNIMRFDLNYTGLTYAREMTFFANNNCSGGNTWVTLASYWGPISITNDGATTYSYKFRNITQESTCQVVTLYHKTSINQSTETVVYNTTIESTNGYNSFFTDISNEISGLCIYASTGGNQYLYNYGLTESNILVTANAYHNADLVTPYYSGTVSGYCSGSANYSLVLPYNANYATADVIKLQVRFKDFFDASLTLNSTANLEKSSKTCPITNGTGSQTYASNGSYNTCSVSSCDSGYSISGNTCVISNTAPVGITANYFTDMNTDIVSTLTATDANSDPLTYIKVSDPSHGTVSITAGTGAFTYTPTTSYVGTDSFTFKVNDGIADSTATTINIQVGCPIGYVRAPADATLSVAGFCIMINEAIETSYGSGIVTPLSSGSSFPSPWVYVTIQQAKNACKAVGSKYDIPSNAEWMAIARNAEGVASNWSSGVVGTGSMAKGHSDDSPNYIIDRNESTVDPYTDTGDTAGSKWNQKRTLTLTNGSVVWDLSGNAKEWVDWAPDGSGTATKSPINASCDNLSDRNIDTIALGCTTPFPANTYLPLNPAGKSTYGYIYGLGQIRGNDDSAFGYAARGGSSSEGDFTGAFSLSVWWGYTETDYSIGFRCVYRPF